MINRIILLGASNLTLSLRLAIQIVQQRLGSPSEVLVALGHGRAYGICSSIMQRRLPGILDSGLWTRLAASESLPSYALLTDIGNDILYELLPGQILGSVERCIDQLQQQSAQIVITNLPLALIESLTERRYLFFRNIFYPFCRLPRDITVQRARELHAGLIALALRKGITLYEQDPHWFGPDGIHVDYWKRQAFYQDVARCFHAPEPEVAKTNPTSLIWQQRPTFAFKTLFGYDLYCPQPSGLLINGSSVCKY
ncbi:hypothetical protein W03_13350 [Nitrosomonas sp. PY1]|uniref:hypothetical protein n=1 Tax=Nitrosomonas sp. PY1 TaxID=1803906 RepID=UPI001FC8659C|nr:hypothetical protein [Nitrosomonas sp. PY1]GKS69331.1 hypothetical protein W03_13350 [Nitrosomonas sp. PY1]